MSNNSKLNLMQIMSEFNDIPALPEIIFKILNVIKNPAKKTDEFLKIIKDETEISQKILNLANSSYYGFHNTNYTLDKAVETLGIMKAKNIAMAVGFKQMMMYKCSRELWEHSVKCAIACEIIAKEYKIISPDDAFVIGLLHDIGKILLNIKDSLKYSKIKYLALQDGLENFQIEDEQFGVSHCVLGAIMSKKWQMPVILTNCIRYHHEPLKSPLLNSCAMVYCADKLIYQNTDYTKLNKNITKNFPFTINDETALQETIFAKASIFLKEMSGF